MSEEAPRASFLARLVNDTPAPLEPDLRLAVLENLRALCRTRQGTMTSCPEYGLPTVSELVHAPESAASFAAALKASIDAFEPRLTAVRVRHIPSEDRILHFEIMAQLVDRAHASRTGSAVKFSTRIGPYSAIIVE
jgi:type VI secretion system lysozyme-like protein